MYSFAGFYWQNMQSLLSIWGLNSKVDECIYEKAYGTLLTGSL